MRAADLVTAALLIAVGLLALGDAIRLGIGWGTDGPKSGFFPFWLAVIMIAACLAIVGQTLWRGDRPPFIKREAVGPVLTVLGPATAFVLLLTGVAPTLGPQLTGLLAPFPLYAAILAVFAHHLHGPAAAISVLRGLLLGLFAFAGFFLALAALIERAGVGTAFAAAIALTLALQAGALWALRRGQSAGTRG